MRLPSSTALRLWSVILALLALVFVRRVMAQFFRVSPGPLDESHAEYDNSEGCPQCHESGQGPTDARCLACHKALRERQTQHRGLHATFKEGCVSCHTQHKGRAFNIIDWKQAGGRETFQHDLTSFSLKNHHANTVCTACHVRRMKSGHITYLGLSSDCQSCHARVHGFDRQDLATQCERCHQSGQSLKGLRLRDWQAQHQQLSHISLEGGHLEQPCTKCHAKAVMGGRSAPRSCGECHSAPHPKTPEMTQCAQCHPSGSPWQAATIDHAKFGFALLGKHKGLDCKRCHSNRQSLSYVEGACTSCHQHRNQHKDQFADKPCASCHIEGGKRTRPFNHDQDTKFPLVGFHADLYAKSRCVKCHEDKIYRTGRLSCIDCHRDTHENQLGGECSKCHSPKQHFKDAKFVNLQHTRFPLEGAHQHVRCEQCHPNGRYKLGSITCVDCHAKDDPHQGKLGRDCAKCHIPAKGAPKFNHETMTRFVRSGVHAQVPCSFCHRAPMNPRPEVGWTRGVRPSAVDRRYPVMGTRCADCHADPHRGEVGDRCDQCHTPSRFDLLSRAASSLSMPKPKDHTGVWIRAHATVSESEADRALDHRTCSPCHQEPACTHCHRTRPPRNHTSLWRVKTHGSAAAFEPETCATCHSTGSCVLCHRRTPPSNHRGDWRRVHGLAATTLDNMECAVCHRPTDCAACHKTR